MVLDQAREQVLMALVLATWEGQDVLGRALLVPAGPRATRRPPRCQLVARAPPNPSQGLVRELFEVPTPPWLPHPRPGVGWGRATAALGEGWAQRR